MCHQKLTLRQSDKHLARVLFWVHNWFAVCDTRTPWLRVAGRIAQLFFWWCHSCSFIPSRHAHYSVTSITIKYHEVGCTVSLLISRFPNLTGLLCSNSWAAFLILSLIAVGRYLRLGGGTRKSTARPPQARLGACPPPNIFETEMRYSGF